MSDVFIDRVTSLSCEEDRGVVRNLTRVARVIFAKTEIATSRNQDVLSLALKHLDDKGYTPFSVIGTLRSESHRFGALTLVKRSPAVAENDPCCVDVTLKYEHLLDGPNQRAIGPTTGVLFGKGRTSIVEKATNKFHPDGDRTKPAQLITVAHKFPTWDVGIVGTPFDPLYPRTVFQGGEITIPYPQSNYQVAGIVTTSRPSGIARRIVAHISEKEWQGERPLTWICSECQWELNDPATAAAGGGQPNYRMTFEFQFNNDGWDPLVIFNDSRTGKPPHNLLPATVEDGQGVLRLVPNPSVPLGAPNDKYPAGYWNVPALARADFDGFFGALFEGVRKIEVA